MHSMHSSCIQSTDSPATITSVCRKSGHSASLHPTVLGGAGGKGYGSLFGGPVCPACVHSWFQDLRGCRLTSEVRRDEKKQ